MDREAHVSPWWNRRSERALEAPALPTAGSDFAVQRLASPRTPGETGSNDDTAGAGDLQDWQDAVLGYSESVPPLAAASRYYKNATLMARFRTVDQAGETVTAHDDILATLHANIEPIARGVELFFLIGDTRGLYDQAEATLEMLSPGELFKKNNKLVRINDKGKPEQLDVNSDVSWRTYEPSVRNSKHAVSSNKALMDVYEAYRIAYGEERALSIRSAMNAGVVLVSDDVFGSAATGEADAVGSAGMDPADALEERFMRMLGRTIKNPRNSAAFAPPALTVPGDVNGKILHVSLAEKRDTRMLERRMKALREEIAIGIDLPADIAAGFFADLNHWNAWSVTEEALKNYLAPKIGMVARDAFAEIAAAIGRDIEGVTLEVDGQALLSQRDLSDTAIDAHAEGLISDKAAREALGYDEDDAPEAGDAGGAGDAAGDTGDLPADSTDSGDTSASAYATRETRAPGRSGHVVRAGLKGEAASKALDTINLSMKAARLRLARDLENDITKLLNQLRSEAATEGKASATGGGPTRMAEGSTDPVKRIIANIASRVTKAYETMSLGAARGLATKQANSWYERTRSAIEAKADKAAAHALKVAQGAIKATASDSALPSGLARQISVSTESVAAGKPASMNAEGQANGVRPGIISENEDWAKLLNDEIDAPVEVQYTWVHGAAGAPFPPHEELDGTEWFVEDERDVLDNPNSFPDSAVYHPGDHLGCTCEYDADMVVKEIANV